MAHPITVENLDARQRDVLVALCQRTVRHVEAAIERLSGVLRQPRDEMWPQDRLLRTHFKIYGGGAARSSSRGRDRDIEDIEKIRTNYKLIRHALRGELRLHFDGTTHPFGLGLMWTSAGRRGVGRSVEVNLDIDAFFEGMDRVELWPAMRMRAIIHELAHGVAGCKPTLADFFASPLTQGERYYGGSDSLGITRAQALRNADSYARYAIPRLTEDA